MSSDSVDKDREARQSDPQTTEKVSEHRQTLWLLAASPTIWATHFMASYLTAAIWCAKATDRDVSLGAARTAIGVYTVLALAAIGVVAWIGVRRKSYGVGAVPHDFDSPAERHRFLGFAGLLLSGLSAVATIFVAMAAYYLRWCS